MNSADSKTSFRVERSQTSLTSRYEKRLLLHIAERLPAWVTPDGLTGLGIVAALTIGTAYLFARLHPAFLWVAVVGWMVHWFGDSLDGTVARVRGIERPRYGHYLDHFVDSIVTLYIGLGFAFSGLGNPLIWIFGVMAYFLLSIHSYLFAAVEHRLKLSYGVMGPTEMRILFIIITILLWLGNPHLEILGFVFSVADLMGLLFILGILCILTIFGIRTARYLEALDRENHSGNGKDRGGSYGSA